MGWLGAVPRVTSWHMMQGMRRSCHASRRPLLSRPVCTGNNAAGSATGSSAPEGQVLGCIAAPPPNHSVHLLPRLVYLHSLQQGRPGAQDGELVL